MRNGIGFNNGGVTILSLSSSTTGLDRPNAHDDDDDGGMETFLNLGRLMGGSRVCSA